MEGKLLHSEGKTYIKENQKVSDKQEKKYIVFHIPEFTPNQHRAPSNQ